jgi:hypothetical protein
MAEWSTYRPSDFLLFSPRAYYRLFELYNAEVWPLHLAAAALGLLLVHLTWQHRAKAACVLLAACWLWVGWAFHWQRFSSINWAATGYAAAFAGQAALLLACAWRAGFQTPRQRGMWIGWGVLLFALFVQPMVGALFGRPWQQAEVFGLAPDPTALATLGVLWRLGGRGMAWLLWPVPLLWCLVSGTTLWTMHAR